MKKFLSMVQTKYQQSGHLEILNMNKRLLSQNTVDYLDLLLRATSITMQKENFLIATYNSDSNKLQ